MSAAEKFLAMHRKIEREIIKYSEGGDREDGAKLSKAINRLADLTNDPELRGTPDNEARWSTVSFLRKAKLAADDVALQARTAGRNAEISRLKIEHANRSENADPYLRELAVERARRGYR